MKKSTNKSMSKVFVTFATVFAFLSFFGCEIGLGPAVDVEAPRVEITSPSTNATVGSNFNIVGKGMDDASVSSIEIIRIFTKVRDASGKIVDEIQWPSKKEAEKGKTLGTIKPVRNGNSWDWNLPLIYKGGTSYECNGYRLDGVKDGNYTVEVMAWDDFNRPSTKASRSFDIDNTAPIFWISSPAEFEGTEGRTEFGRSVAIQGVIADIHPVDVMRVRAFDETGNEITLPKNEFSDFDKATTSVVVAAYSADVAEGNPVEEDVRLLHSNYMALFGISGSNKFDVEINQVQKKNINLYVEVVDKAGNVSPYIYGSTQLLLAIRNKLGIDDLTFEASDCMRILDGSYAGSLVGENAKTVRDILCGGGENNEKYLSYNGSAGHNYITVAVNPNNSPTYSVLGAEVTGLGTEDVKFNAVPQEGAINILIRAGSDRTPIDTSSLSVAIYDVVDGKKLDTPSFEISKDINGSCLIYSGSSVYDSTNFTEATISLDLKKVQDTLGSQKYKPSSKHIIVMKGVDENGGELFGEGTYGFAVLSNSRAAVVYSDENNGVKKFSAIDTFSFPLTITDNENDPSKGVGVQTMEKAVIYKVDFFDGHYSSAANINESKLMAGYSSDSFIAGSRLVSSGDKTFTAYIPLNNGKGSGNLDGKNVTIRITVTAENGLADGEKTVFLLYSDGVKPVLTETNLITGKKINLSDNNYTLSEGKHIYELSGTISDIDGSGIETIYYSYDNGANWKPMTAIPNVSSEASWSQKLEVEEGDGKSVWLKAKDKVENESAVKKYDNLVFDLSIPTVKMTSPVSVDTYYKDAPQLEFAAEDGYKITKINVTAKLNGANDTSFTVVPQGLNTKNATATVKFPAKDGKWEISVIAEDGLGQKSAESTISFIRDKTAPVFKGDFVIKGEKVGEFYRSTILQIEGECTDSTELSEVIYWVGDDSSKAKTEPATDHKFSITPTDFTAENGGVNVLHVQLKDVAGNVSAEKTATIKIDTGKPNLIVAYIEDLLDRGNLETVPSKVFFGDKKPINMSLYGLVSDDGGLASMGFTVNGTAVTPVVTYTTKTLTEESENSDYVSASWVGYGTIADKSKIKAWKADFTQTVVNAASSTGGTLSITANDKAGLATTLANVLSFTKDSTAPAITVKDLSNGKLIDENNLRDDKLVVHGTWSDIGGSGTSVLECKVNGSLLDKSLIDAPSSTSSIAWTVEIPKAKIPAGDGKKIEFIAKDSVGNESNASFIDLIFDYKLPTVTPVTLNEYYSYSSSPLEIIIKGTDDRGVPSIVFDTATLGSVTTIPAHESVNGGKDLKISLPRDGSKNGKWVINVYAKDLAGRDGETYTLTTTVDGKKPTTPAEFYIAGTAYDAAKPAWNKSNLLQIKATTTDLESGIRKVYYKVLDSTVAAPTDLANTNDGSVAASSGSEFNLTVSDLPENTGSKATKVYLQAEDMAGNKSDVASVILNIDQTNPDVSVSYYTFDIGDNPVLKPVSGLVRINGTNSFTVYGKLVETGSGVKNLDFSFGGKSARPDVLKYSTNDITNPSSLPVFTDSKENAKSFMATFSNDNMAEEVGS